MSTLKSLLIGLGLTGATFCDTERVVAQGYHIAEPESSGRYATADQPPAPSGKARAGKKGQRQNRKSSNPAPPSGGGARETGAMTQITGRIHVP